jgi:hypothetical protein
LADEGEPDTQIDVARSLLALSQRLGERGDYAEASKAAEQARGLTQAAVDSGTHLPLSRTVTKSLPKAAGICGNGRTISSIPRKR